MSDQSLFIVNYEAREVTATDYVRELEETALAESALIGKVSNAAENESAVKAQLALKTHIKAITDAEDAIKGPINELKSKVIALAKSLRAQCDAEGLRLAGLVGDFLEKERIRQLAEQNSVNEELSEVTRQEAIELAAAKTVEEQDAVRERFALKSLAIQSGVKDAPRAKGQVAKSTWEVTVVDIWKLVRAHPNAVELKPKMGEIKALLDMGISVAGVEAKKVVAATVRVSPDKKAIEA